MGTPEKDYTVKEILNTFVLPQLDAIEKKVDAKADVDSVTLLATRVAQIEQRVTTPEGIFALVNEAIRVSKTRGWSTRERLLQASVGSAAIISVIINVLASRGRV
jgi:hypothetical protein